MLTVIDQWSRESVLLEAQVAATGQSVVEALDAWAVHHPLPRAITVDHGTEFTSNALDAWAYGRGVQLDFIRPGKPVENAYIESFNGRLRDECLNVYDFTSIAHAQQVLDAWRQDYNQHRPHGALGHLTPNEYATQRQKPVSGSGPAPLMSRLETGATSVFGETSPAGTVPSEGLAMPPFDYPLPSTSGTGEELEFQAPTGLLIWAL